MTHDMISEAGETSQAAPRTFSASERYQNAAAAVIAGGVNSNVRLSGRPLCFVRAAGARLVDLDGNTYVDYALGMGPAILGHAHPEVIAAVSETLPLGQLYAGQHPGELELAQLVCELVPSAELGRFGVTGSEIVQAAIRVARAYTGRTKVVKFEGHYSGWFDTGLASGPSAHGAAGQSSPYAATTQTAGQPPSSVQDLLVLPWNNVEALAQCFALPRDQIAAVLMEPMMCNTGAIVPRDGYLEAARRLCREHGTVLIFDEVLAGLLLAPSGAQGRFGVAPDLSVFAKAVGSGFPLAILAGRAELMKLIASGAVNHSGTYNANVVSTAAGVATLKILVREGAQLFAQLERTGARLISGLRNAASELGMSLRVSGVGAAFNTSFGTLREPVDYASFKQSDAKALRQFLDELLLRGVRPTSRRTWFVAAAHTEAHVEETLAAAREALRQMTKQATG